jgi:hypothetical protein
LLLQGRQLTLAVCLAASGCSKLKTHEAIDENTDASVDASFDASPMGDGSRSESRDSGDRESVDPGCTPQDLYADEDGDGYGDPDVIIQACAGRAGFAVQAGDCDDTCESCFTGGVEVCDGADNDCDGQTDEPSSGVCPGEYCVAGRCEPCTRATEGNDCGPSTACLRRECVANSCRITSLTQCTGPSGQPGTCDDLGTCLYCGDGMWSQTTEQCDESVARWTGACQACVPTYFSHCNVYEGQTTCPSGETCAFTVCARTCDSVLDCPPEPSITCQELVQGGQKACVWACPSPDDSNCPDSQMICDNANFCTFPANL